MAPADRFDYLEDKPELPATVKSAVGKLSRFEHLEIGQLKPQPAPAKPPDGKLLCSHCGQPNEPERETCWACFKLVRTGAPPAAREQPSSPLQKPAPGQEIQLVLDGVTYHSDDPKVPQDIRVLMDRIKAEGYSPALLADWRSWRATRHVQPPDTAPWAEMRRAGGAPGQNVEIFRGQRVSVIRIDGQVYRSDDPRLPQEIKDLFGYIERNGVTPALMDILRRRGSDVKYRPATTGRPSDGDVSFWKEAHVEDLAQRMEADRDILAARSRYEYARGRMLQGVFVIIGFILYVFLQFMVR